MKAGVNGILNLSILDGWFDEAAEQSGGWAIGDRETYSADRDEAHAAAIYSLLENEIVPMYYAAREDGVPKRWMQRVKQSLCYVSGQFNCHRMIADYRSELYEPAHRAYEAIARQEFAGARAYVKWNREVVQHWPAVNFLGAAVVPDTALTGSSIPLRAQVDLAGLLPDDVHVEALVGHIGPQGELQDAQVLLLQPLEQHGTVFLFGREFVPKITGRLGYTVRVSPNHYTDPLNRPCFAPLKWMGEPVLER
jgi:starch phosphorylase